MRDLTMVVSQIESIDHMFWLILFLFGVVCAMICAVAFVVWLGTGVIIGLIDAIEKSLVNLGNGHMIVGLLYLVPAWLFVCAIAQFVTLAISFYTAVLK